MKEHDDKNRVFILDVMRFLSALSVVLYHYAFHLGYYKAGVHSLFSWCRYGHLGVTVFFFISGFVISMSAEGRDWRQFLVSRICRLYPAFLFCCTFTFLFVWMFGKGTFPPKYPLSVYLANLTMIPQLLRVCFIDKVYWTLEIEIVFYVWIFLILLFSKLKHLERYLIIWAVICISNIFLKNAVIKWVFITEQAPSFILGALFYLAAKEKWNLRKGILAVSMLSVCAYFAFEGAKTMPMPINPMCSFVYLGVALCVFVLVSLNRLRLSLHPFLFVLSKTTYPLYLLHDCVGLIMLSWFSVVLPSIRLGLVAGIMILLAVGIWYFVEQPVARVLKTKMPILLEWLFPRKQSQVAQ